MSEASEQRRGPWRRSPGSSGLSKRSRRPRAVDTAGRGRGEPKATAFAESLVWGGAKGWLEVGKGDSVTLIPRLVVELVCCEAEGDQKGHAGGGGLADTSQPPGPNGVNVVELLFRFN